jgi:hypothetical protein
MAGCFQFAVNCFNFEIFEFKRWVTGNVERGTKKDGDWRPETEGGKGTDLS